MNFSEEEESEKVSSDNEDEEDVAPEPIPQIAEVKSSANGSVKSGGHKPGRKGAKPAKGQKNEEDEMNESMDSFLILDDEEIN